MPFATSKPNFTAIDFETANRYPNSACSVALVRVERGRIVERAYSLIRPPFRSFEYTDIHGLDWNAVRNQPTFRDIWPKLTPLMRGVDFLAAHNASFDEGVLRACCKWHDIIPPRTRFRCTVELARETWNVRPTKLPDVARFLRIPLRHHDPRSDAEVCAQIVLRAHEAKMAAHLAKAAISSNIQQ
jgi:DNA polymerase-3 subunit epsilon